MFLWIFYILIFLISFQLLYIAGAWVIRKIIEMARFLGWQEFVVAFFIMAIAASIPNLFLGITSALKGISELSLGDVIGNNIVALTVAIAAAILFAPKKEIETEGQTVQVTAIFTVAAAIMPIIMIADSQISRVDGALLLAFFAFYTGWLFSKKERFSKIYNHELLNRNHIGLKDFLKAAIKIFLGVILVFAAAQGIIYSALFFSKELHLPLIFIGILLTGLGNALPEVYLSIISARQGKTHLILGNLMGSVIIPATLVLGVVALIQPIKSADIALVATGRIFLTIIALSFLLFVRTHRKITVKESIFLFLLYVLFVISVILIK